MKSFLKMFTLKNEVENEVLPTKTLIKQKSNDNSSPNNYLIEYTNHGFGDDKNEYIFIDFETANYERTSACQLAMIKVVQGKIIDEYNSLIKPHPFFFTFTHIHNIDKNDVKSAKTFKELWPDIIKFFSEESIFIAHNAAFDINVLRELIKYYNLQCPNFEYICSVNLFRKTQMYPSNSLGTLAALNQISFKHHDAMADVITLQKLINIHFGENYHLKRLCIDNDISVNKLHDKRKTRKKYL